MTKENNKFYLKTSFFLNPFYQRTHSHKNSYFINLTFPYKIEDYKNEQLEI